VAVDPSVAAVGVAGVAVLAAGACFPDGADIHQAVPATANTAKARKPHRNDNGEVV
jgi:hypothetical protein